MQIIKQIWDSLWLGSLTPSPRPSSHVRSLHPHLTRGVSSSHRAGSWELGGSHCGYLPALGHSVTGRIIPVQSCEGSTDTHLWIQLPKYNSYCFIWVAKSHPLYLHHGVGAVLGGSNQSPRCCLAVGHSLSREAEAKQHEPYHFQGIQIWQHQRWGRAHPVTQEGSLSHTTPSRV